MQFVLRWLHWIQRVKYLEIKSSKKSKIRSYGFNVFSVMTCVDFTAFFGIKFHYERCDGSIINIQVDIVGSVGALWNYLPSLTTLYVTNVGNIRQGNYKHYIERSSTINITQLGRCRKLNQNSDSRFKTCFYWFIGWSLSSWSQVSDLSECITYN